MKVSDRKLSMLKIIWWLVFVCYLIVVLGVTILERSSSWANGRILPLFYSYLDAWYDFSLISWRNIVLNICMFIPFGFLLPLGIQKFRTFWKTYLVGFLFTILIELLQYQLNRGIFELDDVLHNTVGTMIGYGVYVLFEKICYNIGRKNGCELNKSKIIAYQIPFMITVCAFLSIFLVYYKQEIGNLSCHYLKKLETDLLTVESDVELEQDTLKLPVYRGEKRSKAEAEQFAATLFQKMGTELDESDNDFYETTAIFWAEDRFCVWVDYVGGGFSLTDFDTSFSEETQNRVQDASEEEIRRVLLDYGLEIPENAEFKNLETSGLEGYCFIVDQVQEGDVRLDGQISCTYYENGRMGSIDYNISESRLYKEFDAISEQEAYEKICEGEFQYNGSDEVNIVIQSCNLDYMLDSKGYYQPIYVFSGTINGETGQIQIPALNQ